MKSIDFTKPGGFPLTQDQLDYLQTEWNEAFAAFAGLGGAGVNKAQAVMGMVSSGTTTVAVTAGWFIYNGELIRFPAQSNTPGGGNSIYVVLTRTSTPLTYNDGSTPNVINDVTGVLTAIATGTAESSTQFLLSNLMPFRTSEWQTPVYSGTYIAEPTNPLRYRLENGNVLRIQGVTNNSADALLVSTSLVFILPAAFRPNADQYVPIVNPYLTSTSGALSIESANGHVNLEGGFANMRKVGAYINVTIALT